MTKTILDLIECDYIQTREYIICFPTPAKGVLYITKQSPGFISGHVRLRGRNNGSYPYHLRN